MYKRNLVLKIEPLIEDVVYAINHFGLFVMQDTWTDDTGRISVDERQDCDEFDIVRFHGGGTAFTFNRKFDTCDGHDYLIQVRFIKIVVPKIVFTNCLYNLYF